MSGVAAAAAARGGARLRVLLLDGLGDLSAFSTFSTFAAFGFFAVDLKMSCDLPSGLWPRARLDASEAATIGASVSSELAVAAGAGAGAAVSTVTVGSLARSTGTAASAASSRTATGHSRRRTS